MNMTTFRLWIWLIAGLLSMVCAEIGSAQAFSTTTVQGTVYQANGTAATGTLQLSWPAFATASNQEVAAGRTLVTIGSDGFISANLAPNLGATPAGLYYTAVYYFSNGTTSTEYWVVPAAAQATLGQVRAQLMPAVQAVQTVSKSYVDQSIAAVAANLLTASGGDLTGPLYLSGDPTQPTQAADKHYVDNAFAQSVPLSGAVLTGPLTSVQLGAIYQADQFPGADFGARLQSCINGLSAINGGTCDARNFSGALTMASNLNIATANVTVQFPCATISTTQQILIAAGTRNVTLHGCALRGASTASGTQGGTILAYAGAAAMVQVGDPTYTVDTSGFHLDNVVINTTASNAATTQALMAYRTQELDVNSIYLLGNANQTGITLDGTGNYTGGTFQDDQLDGFGIALNAIGHQSANAATTDWMNASTFIRLHIDCPTNSGNPISGTYGINLQQGDGNTFTGGDVEGCATAMHLGVNAQNNTILGLRNENSTSQVVADAGSAYNNWITGGTMFTGKLTDNGTRNSFLDTFHRSFNALNGDWYGSQQDATLTNHYRLGIGSANERGLLNRYQTDYGYRWTTGLSDATAGEQFYQVLDELNNVYRFSIGQYNSGQSSTNNQTVLNAAGTGAVVLNGSNNAGTGGVVIGSGGPASATVATINAAGNAQFNGSLQVGAASTFLGSTTIKNQADAEIDAFLWAGVTTSQKESFIYKDWNGNSQWYMTKDASNNWALNSALGGLDSFKAYQSTNSGDTYINASNGTGAVRVNYETGSGTSFNIYGGGSGNLYASFTGPTSIKFPGLAASSGHNCLQVDNSGYLSNSGSACGSGTGGSGTVGSGTLGQIAYYTVNGSAIAGTSTVPVTAGGTGAGTASGALASLGGASLLAAGAQTFTSPIAAPAVTSSANSVLFVVAPPYNAYCDTVQRTSSLSLSPSGMTSGYTFAASDVGKTVNLDYASGGFSSIIQSVSSGIATLSPVPSAAITTAAWNYGHNDNAAISAAFTAANGNNQSVQFPAGMCMTGTVTYLGQSFGGSTMSLSAILGLPGQDVFAGPDPYSGYPYATLIHDIKIIVDSSVNAASSVVGGNNTFPSRITGTAGGTTPLPASAGGPPAPGPVVFGPNIAGGCSGSITAGSSTFTHSCDYFTNAVPSMVIGAPITINGAGAGSANLTTTITSILSNTQVTIATAASTTVTTASGSWGSPLSAPWYIGNCGMALPASNQATAGGTNGWTWRNVWFTGTTSMQTSNYACGLLISAIQNDNHFEKVDFQQLWGGLIEYLPATYSNMNYITPDTNSYKDVNFKFDMIPMVWYNGAHRIVNGMSIYAANSPMQLGFYQFSPTGAFPSASFTHFYDECWSSNSGELHRFSGIDTIQGGSLEQCGTTSQYVNWTGSNGNVDSQLGGLAIAGSDNTFRHTGATAAQVIDSGIDNSVETDQQSAYQDVRFYANRPRDPLNKLDTGFLMSGNSATPFTSGADLLITCDEFNFAFQNGAFAAPGCTSDGGDAANIAGQYFHATSSLYASGWSMGSIGTAQGSGPYGKYLVVGDRLPQSKTTFVVLGRCNIACTQVYTIADSTSNTTLATATLSFGAAWTTQTFGVNLSSATVGDAINISAATPFAGAATTMDIAYYAFEPLHTDTLNAAANAAGTSALGCTAGAANVSCPGTIAAGASPSTSIGTTGVTFPDGSTQATAGTRLITSATVNTANSMVQVDSVASSTAYGYSAFGDSITAGVGATTGYVSLIGTDLGVTPNNQGVAGDVAADMTWHIFTSLNPGDSGNPIVTAMIGTNNANSTENVVAFSQNQYAGAAWAAMASTNKILAGNSSVAQTGAWTADTTFIYANGLTASAAGSLSYTAQVGPSGVYYVWYKTFSSGGTFTLATDGTPCVDTVSGNSNLSAAWAGSAHQTVSVQMARCVTTQGQHTLKAAWVSGSVTLLGWGFPPTTRYRGSSAPRYYMAGVPPQQNNGNLTYITPLNAATLAISKQLVADGLNVPFVDVLGGTDYNLDWAGTAEQNCPASSNAPLHPNQCGHRHLSQIFESVVGAGLAAPNAALSSPLNYAGIALPTTLPGTANGGYATPQSATGSTFPPTSFCIQSYAGYCWGMTGLGSGSGPFHTIITANSGSGEVDFSFAPQNATPSQVTTGIAFTAYPTGQLKATLNANPASITNYHQFNAFSNSTTTLMTGINIGAATTNEGIQQTYQQGAYGVGWYLQAGHIVTNCWYTTAPTAPGGFNCPIWMQSNGTINAPIVKSGSSSNTDLTGRITLSSGTATYTLTGTYATAPNCVTADATTPANVNSVTESTTTLTFSGTGSDVLKYICVGRN